MLKLQNVVKNYGAFSLHCSLELKSGQLSALIGQNGAGKSTTFKAILGLISIDGGEIEVLGKPVQELTPEEKDAVSHRGNALRIFSARLKAYLDMQK